MDRPASRFLREIDLIREPPFGVGDATIDPLAREAVFGGRRERLQPQTLKVLVALSRRKGEVVTRDELTDACWNGRIVGDDVINRCISQLRKLAKTVGGFRIETVPRCGYRLSDSDAAHPWPGRRRFLIIAGLALVLGAIFLLLALDRVQPQQPGEPTVALLPFGKPSGDRELTSLADTARASVVDALTKGGFPVSLVDEGSAKRRPDLVVKGDVRRYGGSVTLLVQIEETRNSVIVLSHLFRADSSTAQTILDQVGPYVASNLTWVGRLMMLDRRHPSNSAVTARLLEQSDELRAFQIAREIAPRAPNSAIAQLSLAFNTAFVLGQLAREQRAPAVNAARRAAERAVVLAPNFGDAYAASCPLRSPIYIAQCEAELRRGLRADSGAPSVSTGLSGLLNGVGRIDEALPFTRLSLANDPYNPVKLARYIRILEEMGNTSEADRQFRQARRWWPDDPSFFWSRLVGMASRGDYAAIDRFQKQYADVELPLDRAAFVQLFGAWRAHDGAKALATCADPELRWTTQSICMTVLADLGQLDRAFEIARTLFPSLRGSDAADRETSWLDQPSAFSVAVLSQPAARALRRDDRFLEIADGSGLIEYWRKVRTPDFCRKKPEPVCRKL